MQRICSPQKSVRFTQEAPHLNSCRSCGKVFNPHTDSRGLYCSNQCQKDYEHTMYIERWLQGLERGWIGQTRQVSNHVRRWVRETKGTACQQCGWDEKHPVDGAVLTELDHIDGDAENVSPENLRVLCPNCHSMTPTFRARNKSSKRVRK